MKNLLAGLALVGVFTLGVYVFFHPASVPIQDSPKVGGADSSFPCETHNGTTRCSYRLGFNAASTTILAIKSPSASSTLTAGSGCYVSVSSTTASILTVAKATTAFATTTVIVNPIVVSANAETTFQVGTTTTNASAATGIFAPNTFLVIGMQGGTGTFSPSGGCNVSFDTLI